MAQVIVQLYAALLFSRGRLLFHRLYAGYGGSVPLHQPILAFHRFHGSPLASHDVRDHLLFSLGRYVRGRSPAHGQGTAPDPRGHTFLDGADWPAVLYRSPDVWRDAKGTLMDSRQAFYRGSDIDGTLLVMESHRG